MIRAFIDDSGSGGDSRWYVLAGFSADLPTWESFADAWQLVLDSPPRIEHFKMAAAESRKGPFQGFTETERNQKVNALIEVILAHDVFEGSCKLAQEEYNRILRPVVSILPDYDDPYLFLFAALVTLFASWERHAGSAMRDVPIGQLVVISEDPSIASGGPPQKVDCVFDKQGKNTERRAKRLYERMLSQNNPVWESGRFVENIDYKDDKQFLPLQAADLAAWQCRRRFCGVAEGTRVAYQRLHRDPRRFYHHTIGTTELRNHAVSMRAGETRIRRWLAENQGSSLG